MLQLRDCWVASGCAAPTTAARRVGGGIVLRDDVARTTGHGARAAAVQPFATSAGLLADLAGIELPATLLQRLHNAIDMRPCSRLAIITAGAGPAIGTAVINTNANDRKLQPKVRIAFVSPRPAHQGESGSSCSLSGG
jgi:hypothetical protein